MMKKWTAALLACMMMCMFVSGAMAADKCSHTAMPGYKSVYFEGFEDDSTLDFADLDGDGFEWYWDDPGEACDGVWVMRSDSWSGETLEGLRPDNWLILPKMSLSSNSLMTFRARCYNEEWPAEHFGVYVATKDSNYEGFEEIDSYTLTAENVNWTTFQIDLSAYAGQRVRLAFRHWDCYDQEALHLDCVHVWAPDSKTAASLPSTGDDSNIALWIGLMAISFLGAAVLSRKAKKAC